MCPNIWLDKGLIVMIFIGISNGKITVIMHIVAWTLLPVDNITCTAFWGNLIRLGEKKKRRKKKAVCCLAWFHWSINVFICWQYQADALAISSKQWSSRRASSFNNTHSVCIWIESKSQERINVLSSASLLRPNGDTYNSDGYALWTHRCYCRKKNK